MCVNRTEKNSYKKIITQTKITSIILVNNYPTTVVLRDYIEYYNKRS